MLEQNVITTSLICSFIEETGYKPLPIEKEIDAGDLFIFDEETQKMINYGDINNIINSDDFKKWYESKGEKNG